MLHNSARPMDAPLWWSEPAASPAPPLVALLAETGWDVLALSRGGVARPVCGPSVRTSPLRRASRPRSQEKTRPTCSSQRGRGKDTERENIDVNAALLRNLLNALQGSR